MTKCRLASPPPQAWPPFGHICATLVKAQPSRHCRCARQSLTSIRLTGACGSYARPTQSHGSFIHHRHAAGCRPTRTSSSESAATLCRRRSAVVSAGRFSKQRGTGVRFAGLVSAKSTRSTRENAPAFSWVIGGHWTRVAARQSVRTSGPSVIAAMEAFVTERVPWQTGPLSKLEQERCLARSVIDCCCGLSVVSVNNVKTSNSSTKRSSCLRANSAWSSRFSGLSVTRILETSASSPGVRSRMQLQRAADTAPEVQLRRELHRRGLRYRLHQPIVPGTRRRVDIVFPSARVAVDVRGCFWHSHQHDVDRYGHTRVKNTEYWAAKLERNRRRDQDTEARLAAAGWHVIVVWECQSATDAADLIQQAVRARN